MVMRSCAWSDSCSVEVSAAPLICASKVRVCWASERSSFRSGPLMITARSADEPVTISVAVSMMGWVKLKLAPGIVGVQVHEELIAVGPEGIRAGIVAASLRGDGLDLRRLANEPANLPRDLRGLLEGDARG